MTFDLEKYEDAILSQDDTRRINAGLELAEIVPNLEPETLKRFSQPIVDLLLKALLQCLQLVYQYSFRLYIQSWVLSTRSISRW